jgi:hypothetical protein
MGDYRRYGYRPDRSENPLPLFLLVGVFLCVLGAGTYYFAGVHREKEDSRRMMELRVEHGNLENVIIRLPSDHPDRPRLESKLRDVTAEHNAILSRHPTWTQKPLDTLANTR